MDDLALSTSYFAGRRLTPAAMAAAVRGFGLDRVELGYLTRETEVEAWEAAVAAEGLTVGSVHAFCPASVSNPFPGPESFSLAVPDGARRAAAVRATFATLDCAVRFGARAVVMHGGRVELRRKRALWGTAPYRSRLSEAFRSSSKAAALISSISILFSKIKTGFRERPWARFHPGSAAIGPHLASAR